MPHFFILFNLHSSNQRINLFQTNIFFLYPPENVGDPEFLWRFQGGIVWDQWPEICYLVDTADFKHDLSEGYF